MPDINFLDPRDKSPRKLKSFSQDDLLSIRDKDDNYLVATKIETKNIIKEFIKDEFDFLTDNIVVNQTKQIEKEIQQNINARIITIEKSVSAYIDYKFDQLSEKICDLLITRKFTEEVDRKVKERLNKRGGF